MSVMGRIMSGLRLGRKDSAVAPLIAVQRMGRPVWSSRNYRGFSKEGYSQNVIAYRAIRMIAEAASNLPVLAFEGDKELAEHPFLAVLRQPNPWQSGAELMDALISYFRIAGDCFLEAVILDGQIRELYALRPDRMTAIAGRRGYPSAWKYSVDGSSSYTFEMDLLTGQQLPILHVREFNPLDDWGGLSPVEAAAFAIDCHNAAGAYNKALLDNGAAPSGALTFKGSGDGEASTLTDDQFRRLKAELEEKHSGPKNAGRPLLLEGGLQWEAMGMAPKDLEFTSGKREAAREIALAFGVPPMLLGIPGDNTYSNYQEARAALYEETVIPLATKVLRAIGNWVQPTYDGLRLEIDLDRVDALAVRRAAVWDRVKAADFLTVDEKRAATGYGDYAAKASPGGKIYVAGTTIPLDDVGFTDGGPEPIDGQ